MESEHRRIHCHVAGTVQGVWYRAGTKRRARELGVFGWVRNLEDGRVELVAEGPRAAVDALERWLHEGPSQARVTAVEVVEEPVAGTNGGFEILY